MSSTGRSDVRRADDFYETPGWCVDLILPKLGELTEKKILEPSAGRGAIVVRLIVKGANPFAITAVELDSERANTLRASRCAVECQDFLLRDPAARAPGPHRWDLIIMNPPFSAAQEHIEHALRFLASGGKCAALLRLAFVCSKKRAAFRGAHPFDLYPLASRPSFTGNGTDSADYAWLVWGEGCGGRFEVLEGFSR
jgi:hypothetical protein